MSFKLNIVQFEVESCDCTHEGQKTNIIEKNYDASISAYISIQFFEALVLHLVHVCRQTPIVSSQDVYHIIF